MVHDGLFPCFVTNKSGSCILGLVLLFNIIVCFVSRMGFGFFLIFQCMLAFLCFSFFSSCCFYLCFWVFFQVVNIFWFFFLSRLLSLMLQMIWLVLVFPCSNSFIIFVWVTFQFGQFCYLFLWFFYLSS